MYTISKLYSLLDMHICYIIIKIILQPCFAIPGVEETVSNIHQTSASEIACQLEPDESI